MPEIRTNLVTFTPLDEESTRVFLTLPQPFVIKTGLRPDVVRAVVPYTEYDKLGGKPIRTGRLDFWYSSLPPTRPRQRGWPDVSYVDMRIVDVEPGDVGIPAGQSTARVVEYTLLLSDFRERFVPPRGGRVYLGLVNPVIGETLAKEEDADPTPDAMKLMQTCLGQMLAPGRYEIANAPPIQAAGTPGNLQWRGGYATVEMGKLLDHSSSVFCPQTSGVGAVYRIGEGREVEVPDGRLMATPTIPGADRRGRGVIFTSAPNAVIETQEVKGPHADGWEFVIQDTEGAWRQIDDAKLKTDLHKLIVGSPEDTVRSRYAGVNPLYVDRVRSQLYRCIRLTKFFTKNQPKRLIRRRVEQAAATQGGAAPKPKLKDVEVFARIARFDPESRMWSNGPTATGAEAGCTVRYIYSDQNIVQLAELLGTVEPPPPPEGQAAPAPPFNLPEIEPYFRALKVDGLRAKVSFESAVELAGELGKFVPEYFFAGFYRNERGVTEMTRQEILGELVAPDADTVFISRPDLRLVRDRSYNFSSPNTNEEDLKTRAKDLAVRYLAAPQTPQVMYVKGWWKVELNGLVSEVELDQAASGAGGPTTTVRLNTGWTPLGAEDVMRLGRSLGRGAGGGRASYGEEAFPSQVETGAEALSMGAATAPQPIVPLSPAPPPAAAAGLMFVVLSKADGENGTIDQTATYVYDVFAREGGTPLATKQTPQWGRSAGRVSLATVGIAHVFGGQVRLLVANELPSTGKC